MSSKLDASGLVCFTLDNTVCMLLSMGNPAGNVANSVEMGEISELSLPPQVGSTRNNPETLPPAIPYSVFSKSQKRMIVFLAAFAAMFSPLSSFIYYPAITAMSKDLHVSIEKINLTITSYMIVSGIAPAVIGDLADMTGRRWVYIITLAIYLTANLGLALQRSWPALFALRMLQSIGSSGKKDFRDSIYTMLIR